MQGYKFERNPLKILKVHFFGNVAGPQSATLSKNKLHYKYLLISFSTF